MTDSVVNASDVPTVSVIVNGREIQAQPGDLLIDACERNGTYIPRFCHHPRMNPVGMCRMCLVEVDTGRGFSLQPSCMLPVADKMSVRTESAVTKKAQDGVLEFLLINHPLDCPICDKGGECPLQDQTMAYGPGESRFDEEKRNFTKPIPISETVYLDRERCILCDRCTRFADEVAGDALIHFMDRGAATQVNTFPDEPFASYFSGNTVQICPVGALTAKPYRFKARPWDLKEQVSSAWTDSVGSRIKVQASRDQVLRVLGVDADPVNWGWLSDKERFAFQALNSESRLLSPLLRRDGAFEKVGWGAALDHVAGALAGVDPQRVALLGGARLLNEAQYCWAKLAKGVIGTDHVDAQMGDGLPAELVLALPRATIDDVCRAGGTIILCGPDPKEDLGALYLRLRHAVTQDGATLIELTPTRTGLSDIAAHSLLPKPGELAVLTKALVGALQNLDDPELAESSSAIYAAARAVSGPVTVVLGRASLSESAQDTVEAALALADIDGVRFLSALRRGNIHGALDAGLVPGLLPGRTTLAKGAKRFESVWPRVPSEVGYDTQQILAAAAAGEIDVLFLLGADPVSDCVDVRLANAALSNCGTVIAVDLLPNMSLTEHADVVLPAAGATEAAGSFTNLEGRVSVCEKVVSTAGVSWPDWMIAAAIAEKLGHELGFDSPLAVRSEMAELSTVPHSEVVLDEAVVDGVLVVGSGDIELPQSTGVPNPPNDGYSLRLVATRRMYDNGVALRHCPASRGLVASFELRLNPIDFHKIGVAEGEMVKVVSAHSSLVMPLRVDAGVPVGVAAVPWGTEGQDCRPLISSGDLVTDVRVERL